MKYTEETTLFACSGDTLLGILAKPETPGATGVVVIVGGPQYRVGSHRQFVLLSRALAAAGYPVLRFDYRGMGDSEGQPRDFYAVSADIAAAMDILHKLIPSVKHVALWGLCDGASAALLYCHETNDPRVSALCLLNPWVRSEASLARTHVKHYYAQRLMQKGFWLKLLGGKVAWSSLTGLARNVRLAASGSGQSTPARQPYQERMANAWRGFPGSILVLLSGEDYVAREFLDHTNANADWTNAFGRAGLQRQDLPTADHTFSSTALRTVVEKLTLDWLERGERTPNTAPTVTTTNT